MTDDGAELARRKFLERSAIAVGFVWSAPVVRSVHRLGSVGTPAPPTSDTTPPSTRYTFAGSWPEVPAETADTLPGCLGTGRFVASADLSTLGPSTITETYCVGPGGLTAEFTDGNFSLSSDDGSLSGTLVGGELRPPGITTRTFTMEIAITDGTDRFHGASGSATIDGILRLDLATGDVFFQGAIVGTFDVPN